LAALQGTLMLQVPPQLASALAPLRNWRAETVPAQSTAVTITANHVFLIAFLPMFALLFSDKAWLPGLRVRYFFGEVTPASFVVQNAVVGVVKEQTQLEVGQGWVALQVPPQVNPLTPLRNCRAETVPTQRTAVTMAPSNAFLMVFLVMIVLLRI
jgi:hypothetical protein